MHTLLIIPGFGLNANDYASLVESVGNSGNIRCSVLDVWPQNLEDTLKIGKPGTESFRKYFSDTIEKCKQHIQDIEGSKSEKLIFNSLLVSIAR